jgi:hypothetical protein
LNTTGDRVMRGGSWIKSNTEQEVRSARRQRADPSLSTENIGFRCVNTLDNFVPVTGLPTATPRNSFTATSMAATNQVRKTKESEKFGSTALPPSGSTQVDAALVPSTEITSAVDVIVTANEEGITPGPAGAITDPDGVTPDPAIHHLIRRGPPDPGTSGDPGTGGDPGTHRVPVIHHLIRDRW